MDKKRKLEESDSTTKSSIDTEHYEKLIKGYEKEVDKFRKSLEEMNTKYMEKIEKLEKENAELRKKIKNQ